VSPPNERLTVATHLANWLESVRPPNTRPTTYTRYEGIVRLYLIPAVGSALLTRLSPSDVERMLASIRERRSHHAASHARAVLRTALARAVRHRVVSVNVASLATWKQPPFARVRYLSPDDVRTLLSSIDGDLLEPLVTVAIFTGARQGELLGLRWQDINLETRTVSIRHALQRGELVETKTERSRRTIIVPAIVEAALRRQRTRQAEQRLLAGSRWTDRGLVFTTSVGTPHDATNVTKRYQRLLRVAGLPKLRFHDLRHTSATVGLALGESPREIMERLGHSQITLTMNTYSHIIPALQREAADRIDRAFGS